MPVPGLSKTMHIMSGFMRHVLAMPMPWPAWVALLFLVNTGAVAFLPRPEAWVVLGGLGLGAMLQMAIFARLGFVRLLGLGHVHWVAMVAWLWSRLDLAAEPALSWWMIAVIVLCGVSLAIDAVDVLRYVRGERAPTVVVDRSLAGRALRM
jgi:hypothetical protein